MNYIIRRHNIGKNKLCDSLRREAGILYSNVVNYFWKQVNENKIWTKRFAMEKLFNSKKLHAHSADGVIQSFFSSLDSWRELKKSEPNAKPPYKTKKYFKIIWKNTAIHFKNGNLILSNGKITEPLIIENWKHNIPKQVELGWNGSQYELIHTFEETPLEQVEQIEEKLVGVDIGQINILATSNGHVVNGRKLRSLKQWRNKKLADYSSKLDNKKKGSKRRRKLANKKRKFRKTVENKERDILHKLTTGLVETQKNLGVTTLVIGDLNGFRQENDIGKVRNQENHQWCYGKISQYLTYKAKRKGIKVVFQEESYTSQTCPNCGHRHKPKNRIYNCSKCSFIGHRDTVGSHNILDKKLNPEKWNKKYDESKYSKSSSSRQKYAEVEKPQLVVVMAPTVFIRWKSNEKVVHGFKRPVQNLSSFCSNAN